MQHYPSRRSLAHAPDGSESKDLGEEDGYEPELFVEMDPSKLEEYRCPICIKTLRQAVETKCGHLFCKYCLTRSLAARKQCPKCREPLMNSFQDWHQSLSVDRAINAQRVRCTNSAQGCDWRGCLSDYASGHMQSCPFQPVKCSAPQCHFRCARSALAEHEAACPHVMQHCPQCAQLIRRDALVTHSLVCPMQPADCRNACGVRGLVRKNAEAHANECPLAVVRCSFGCQAQLQRQQLAAHNQSSSAEHLSILQRDLLQARGQLTAAETQIADLKRQLDESHRQHDATKRSLQDMNTKVNRMDLELCDRLARLEASVANRPTGPGPAPAPAAPRRETVALREHPETAPASLNLNLGELGLSTPVLAATASPRDPAAGRPSSPPNPNPSLSASPTRGLARALNPLGSSASLVPVHSPIPSVPAPSAAAPVASLFGTPTSHYGALPRSGVGNRVSVTDEFRRESVSPAPAPAPVAFSPPSLLSADSRRNVSMSAEPSARPDLEAQYAAAGAFYDKRLYAEAAALYQTLAAHGHVGALFDLGFMCFHGEGMEKDEAQGIRWYRAAAERGHPKAHCHLGIAYEEGQGGLAPDPQQAAYHYQMAAGLGNALGQTYTGMCYELGLGLPRDPAQAFRYYEMAAKQSERDATFYLARCYETGCGCAVNREYAYRLYDTAARLGHAQAAEAVARLSAELMGAAQGPDPSEQPHRLSSPDQGPRGPSGVRVDALL